MWLLLSAGPLCAAQPAPPAVGDVPPVVDVPPDAERAALDQTLVDLGLDAGALAFEDGVALTRALSTGERRAAWSRGLLAQHGAARATSRDGLDRALAWFDAAGGRCDVLADAAGADAPVPASRDARLMTSEQWRALAQDARRARDVLLAAHEVNVVADVTIRDAGGEAKSSFAADQPVEIALAIRSREAEPAISAVAVKLTLTVAGAASLTHDFPSVALAGAAGEQLVWNLEADANRTPGEWKLGVSVASADAAWPAGTSAELLKLAEPVTAAVTITAPAVANNGGAAPVVPVVRTENLSRWSMANLLRGLDRPAERAAVEWYLGLSPNAPADPANWAPAGTTPLFSPDPTVPLPTIGPFQNQGARGAAGYLNAVARHKANRVRSEAERFKGEPLKALAVQVHADGERFNFVGSPALSSSPTNAKYDLVVELVRLADGAVEGVALLRTGAVGAGESYYRVEWLATSPDVAMKQRLQVLVQQQMPARNRVDVLLCLDRGMKSFREGAPQWLGASSVQFTPFAAFELQMQPGDQVFSTKQRQFLEGFPGAE
ncbi:MAG: hypothetical protein AB7Q17_18465 [Phycisphaerae bacterium]